MSYWAPLSPVLTTGTTISGRPSGLISMSMVSMKASAVL